jgi:hypothetical protein
MARGVPNRRVLRKEAIQPVPRDRGIGEGASGWGEEKKEVRGDWRPGWTSWTMVGVLREEEPGEGFPWEARDQAVKEGIGVVGAVGEGMATSRGWPRWVGDTWTFPTSREGGGGLVTMYLYRGDGGRAKRGTGDEETPAAFGPGLVGGLHV